jgi:bifunctional DNA primase/polymerase-like protein
MTAAPMLRTALRLAARGLHVFPCAPSAKTPACAHGCKDATTDIIVIQGWWGANPDFNIGVATGAASSIFVIDIDDGAAETALKKLEECHGELPPTVEAITPRGRHIYFRYPQAPVPNSAGKLADGLDVRGDGGYVLAPPSLHPSGRRYTWSVELHPSRHPHAAALARRLLALANVALDRA